MLLYNDMVQHMLICEYNMLKSCWNYLYFSLFLTRRDSLGKETFHESMEFFLNFQDADIFHFVKTMVKYYREEHPPISTPKAKENEAIFLRLVDQD